MRDSVAVIIGVGSNINPRKNIALAKKEITKKFTFISKSIFIKTKPIGYKNQDDFINGAFLIETNLNIELLNKELKIIEVDIGRIKQKDRFGPRVIDLDIVYFNGEIIDNDYYTRDFLKKSVDELIKKIISKS